jgi:cellulose synthase/poly-beta-1,6-N-acetylglucosamine synthase-like glycosyltransferase
MIIALVTFWMCLALILHTYLLYPVLLFIAYCVTQVRRDWSYLSRGRDRRRRTLATSDLPGVSVIIPAFNEAASLPRKLRNLAELDYPRERLDIILVSDGSTDGTNEIMARIDDPSVTTVFQPVRQGKAAAVNRGVAVARHDILVFCDAATLLDAGALRSLVRHFADPSVGAVCGAVALRGSDEFKQTEGVYWRYESMLRLMEGRLGATLAASGAIYAVRRACVRPLTADDIIDDFILPMNARKRGFRVVFDPEAQALEFGADSVRDEFTRRVRLAIGSFRALREFRRVRMGLVAGIAFFSHKLLRWVLPFLMIGALLGNLVLLDGRLYRVLLAGQLLFYLWAALGFALRRRGRTLPGALLAYFLVAVNFAFLVGFVRAVRGRNEIRWQRVH